jgi:hypothetical protein
MLDAAVLQPAMQFTADRPKPPNKMKRYNFVQKECLELTVCSAARLAGFKLK